MADEPGITDTITTLVRLARFALLATLGLAAALLLADMAGMHRGVERFLTPNVTMNIVTAFAVEFIAAAVGILALTLLKR